MRRLSPLLGALGLVLVLHRPAEAADAPPVVSASSSLPEEAFETQPIIDVFGEYMNRRADGEWFHIFELPRAHLGAHFRAGDAEARVVLEAARSAGPGSLIGVGGNSLVVRAREAYAAYWLGRFEVAGGLVPLLTVPALEGAWGLRAVDASIMERAGHAAYSDLGGRLRFVLPQSFGWLGASVSNGEGYTQRELNRGKNVEVAARIAPLARFRRLAPLSIMGAYVKGSHGTGSTRADRAMAGLSYGTPRFGAGGSFSYAWGLAELPQRRGTALELYVRGEPVERFLLAARVTREERARGEEDVITRALATAGFRATRRLELFLTGERTLATDAAAASLPGIEDFRLRLTARFHFYPQTGGRE